MPNSPIPNTSCVRIAYEILRLPGMRTPSLIILLLLTVAGQAQPLKKGKWQQLFNGRDLTGWDTYIGRVYDTLISKRAGEPMGLNRDPDGVFSVVREDGASAIRISGQHFGGISTLREFENYHLKLEFKWGKQKWPPRRNQKRDSGVLYHAVGPHGKDGGSWMRSQEFQVQEGDCGDYWGVAGAVFDIPARKTSGDAVYDASAPLLTFRDKGEHGRHCVKDPDNEKPSGEWNTLEIYCYADTAIHVMNGKVVMVLYRSRQTDNETETPLTKGKIQIQSEGAEVYYRNIVLTPIDRIPPDLKISQR